MKILQIGAGGIGSYIARHMNELAVNGVLGTEDMEITIVDDDIVEEKNIKYQNFPEVEDLCEPKAKVIGERYIFNYKIKKVKTEEDLKGYDLIVLCVDNGKCRKLIYKFCEKNTNVRYIDLRCEGTAVCFYTTHEANTVEKMLKTIDIEGKSRSCQLEFELKQGKIQQGNKIIAAIGSQLLLNELRGEGNIDSFTNMF